MLDSFHGDVVVVVSLLLDPVEATLILKNKSEILSCFHIIFGSLLIFEYNNRCYNFPYIDRNSPISPFCDYLNDLTNPITRVGCTYDRLARSYCNLIEYSSTRPSEYQVN